jgi:hypothetical protein
MRRALLAISVVLIAVFAPLFARQNFPAIVFDSETKDLGRVPEGEDLKQVFKFTNNGQGRLEILNVQPG